MTHTGPTLITGVAGFIGSHLARVLLARGERVVGVDNFDPMYGLYDESIKRANLASVEQAAQGTGDPDRFSFMTGDVRDQTTVATLYDRHEPRATIHLAARAGVRPSVADPAGYVSFNVEATSRLLEAATAKGRTSPFVLASSSSVYGNSGEKAFKEDIILDKPISPYAATKRACELVGYTFHHLYGLPVACARLFTVYGPRQRPDLAIAKFMRLIRAGEPIPVFGDGSMARDFTYVDDIVAGLIACRDRISEHGYRIWNIGSDRPIRLDEMVAAVGRAVGQEPIIDRKDVPPGDVERTCADLTRARAELGYEPSTPFATGLAAQAGAV
jgi:UDP-glucuronate 4-epimerase